VAVKEKEMTCILAKDHSGCTDKSYGIHVGKACRCASEVTQRAKEILKEVENEALSAEREGSANYAAKCFLILIMLSKESPLVAESRNSNVDAMTPIEALNTLSALKKKAGWEFLTKKL